MGGTNNGDRATESTPLISVEVPTGGGDNVVGSSKPGTTTTNTAGEDARTTTTTTASSSPGLLAFFVAWALIEGSIQVRYRVWWGAGMNAVLAGTGIASLLVATGTVATPARTAEGVHLATLAVWTTAAVVAVVLFGTAVLRNGVENLMALCLDNSGASSYYLARGCLHARTVPLGVCVEYATDGTFRRIQIAAALAGTLLGGPVLYLAVRTVYRFYAEAARTAASTATPPTTKTKITTAAPPEQP